MEHRLAQLLCLTCCVADHTTYIDETSSCFINTTWVTGASRAAHMMVGWASVSFAEQGLEVGVERGESVQGSPTHCRACLSYSQADEKCADVFFASMQIDGQTEARPSGLGSWRVVCARARIGGGWLWRRRAAALSGDRVWSLDQRNIARRDRRPARAYLFSSDYSTL